MPPLPSPHLPQYLGQDDSEIDLTCHGEPEFSEFTWMHLDHLPERVGGAAGHLGGCLSGPLDRSLNGLLGGPLQLLGCWLVASQLP